MEAFDLIWYVLGLPLAGALFQALFGKLIISKLGNAKGKKVMGAMAVLPVFAAFGIGLAILNSLLAMDPGARTIPPLELFNWLHIASIRVPFEVLIDPLSVTMVLIITGIGALIHLYATGYMSEEKDYSRFFTYLNLFVAAMLMLVLANNLPLMFVGWEGVGACSYLLIGFWYKDVNNAKAANKAFIVNRIGDFGLMLGMFLLVVVVAGEIGRASAVSGRILSYDIIEGVAVNVLQDKPVLAGTIALLLFVGAVGKSAQFPLYLWLPDAMAGPTPVSALIHAATMVTAGVFLLNRLHVLFELSPFASAIVAAIGAFTALFAGLIAFAQTDIKKVLAYSTVSQLGFMFIACGAGAWWAGMFHVTTHAFFKALLFLGAGAVIHAMMHNQDMRNYGGLLKYLPITGATMLIGWLAISGVPIFAGFYSKEAILGSALAGHFAEAEGVRLAYYSGWVGLAAAALTALYMTRMTILTFFGKERWKEGVPATEHHDDHAHEAHALEEHGEDQHGFFYSHEEVEERQKAEHEHHHDLEPSHKPKEVPISMWFPLVVLAALSLGGGWYLNQHEMFKHWLYPNGPTLIPDIASHPHGINLVAWSLAAAGLGIIAAFFYYSRGLPTREGWDTSKWTLSRRTAYEQFGYDRLATECAVDGGRDIAKAFWKGIDVGLIDGIVNGVAWLAGQFGNILRRLQTGYVRFYAMMMLMGGVGILSYFVYLITRTGR